VHVTMRLGMLRRSDRCNRVVLVGKLRVGGFLCKWLVSVDLVSP